MSIDDKKSMYTPIKKGYFDLLNKRCQLMTRNLCTHLLKKAKKEYYSKLNSKNITDNKRFWRTVKPLFSDKSIGKETITLVDNDEMFQDELVVAEKFTKCFRNTVTNLEIQFKYDDIISNTADTDPVLRAISKYSMHLSILKINELYGHEYKNSFSFRHATYENSPLSLVKSLDSSKISPNNSIPVNIIKVNQPCYFYQ